MDRPVAALALLLALPSSARAAGWMGSVSADVGLVVIDGHALRDDTYLTLRAGYALGRHVALQAGLGVDLEPIGQGVVTIPGLIARAGVMVRPLIFQSWRWRRLSSYARGELGVATESCFNDTCGATVHLVFGPGLWVRVLSRLAAFVEADSDFRLWRHDPERHYNGFHEQLLFGVAVTSPAFWRLPQPINR